MEVEEEESSSSSSEYLRSRSEFLSHLHLRPKTDDQVQEERPRTHFTRSCNRGELPETEESPGNPRNESPIRNEELYLQAELDQESWRILDLKCSDRPPDPPLGFTTKLKLRKTARGWQAEGINSEDNNSGARKLRRKWFKKRKRWKEEKKLKRILGSSHRHRRHHRDRDREGSSEKSAKDEETKTRNREEEVDSGNATVNANATEAKVSLPQFQKGATRKFDRPVAIVHARRSSPDRPPSSSVTCDTPPICGDEESDHQSTESTTDSLLKSILETNPSSSEGRSILQDLLAKPPPLKTEGEGSDESTLLVPRTLLPALLSCPHLYLDEVVSCQAALVSQAAQNPNLLLQGALMMLPQEVFPHLLKDGTGVLQTMLKASDPVHCISSFTQDSGGSVVYRPSREPDKYSILKSFLRNDHEEEKPAEIRVKSGQELFQTSPPRHWESLSGTGGKGEKVKRKRFHLDAIVDNLKRRRQLQEDEEFGRNSGIDPGTAMRLRHKILSARVPALIPLSAFHAKDDNEVMGMPIEGDLETMEKSQDSPDSALDSIGQQVQEPKENGEEESPKEAEEGENEAEKAISESSASPASKNDKLTEPKEPETGENRVEDGDVERKGSEEEEEEEEGSGGGGGGQGSHEDDEPGDVGEVVQKDVEGDSDSQGSMTLKDSECQVSTSEAGNLGKRPLDENSSSASSEPKRPRLASPIPEELPQVKDMDTLENLMHSVRKEIRDLDTQVKEKEREWNYLIHLKKRKEEYYLRLKRKKAVEAMQTKSSSDKELLSLLQGPSGKPSSTTSPLLSAELRRCDPVSSRSASESLLSAELRRDASMPRVLTLNPESLYTTKPRVNLEAEQRMLLHEALYASKPKVSVDSLIAEHRARNPHPPELRGKRPRMRENPDKHSPEVEILVEPSSSKVIGSKEVSSSSAAGSGESSSSSSTKVLYRDMLVHLAKMSEGKSCVPLARPGPTPSSSTPRLNSAADSLQNISLKSLLDDTRKGRDTGSSACQDNVASSSSQGKGKEGSNKVGESQPQPKCQGCKRSAAQFVCAGCNRQWYCSRECQVNDWDEHAEVCSG